MSIGEMKKREQSPPDLLPFLLSRHTQAWGERLCKHPVCEKFILRLPALDIAKWTEFLFLRKQLVI